MKTRNANFVPETANVDSRSIEVIWSTGAPVLRSGGWGEKSYYEELDLTGADLSRFNRGAPVLNSHQSRNLSDQLGVVEKAWVEEGVGKAKIRFSSRNDVAPIFKDICDGILRNVSIGYKINKQSLEKKEGDEPDVLRVQEFSLYELSFVPIPADGSAQTRAEETTNKEKEPLKLERSEKEILSKERARAVEIRDLCKKFDVEGDHYIEAGTAIEEVRLGILQELANKPTSKIKIERGDLDESVTKREAITNALEHRIDSQIELKEYAKKYFQHSLTDMAREFVDNKTLSRTELATRAFHSTSDFPKILGNLANTTLQRSYETLVDKQNFRPLTKNRTVRDFKPVSRVRLGETPSFKPLIEGAEITYATLGESQEQVKISSYGRGISITREAIINDSLDAFTSLRSWGAAAARLESKLFWDEFVNGKLSDGKTIYHKDHNNLIVDAPLSVDSLAKARIAMAKHQGLDKREGDYLDITPKYLVVPIELLTQAQQLMSQGFTPNDQGKINVFAGAYTILTDPRLGSNAWYLAASPDYIDIAEMIYLEGNKGPTTESQVDFNTSSLRIKATMDVGCKILDYRGLLKSNI